MIKAKATTEDGRDLVILGLAEENMIRLRKGEPIHIKAEEMSLPHDIIIVWGRDIKDLMNTFKPLVGDDTKLRVGTLHGGKPPEGSKL